MRSIDDAGSDWPWKAKISGAAWSLLAEKFCGRYDRKLLVIVLLIRDADSMVVFRDTPPGVRPSGNDFPHPELAAEAKCQKLEFASNVASRLYLCILEFFVLLG